MPNIVEIFNGLTIWMPAFMQTFMKAAFLFFCASAFTAILIKFVRFVRGR